MRCVGSLATSLLVVFVLAGVASTNAEVGAVGDRVGWARDTRAFDLLDRPEVSAMAATLSGRDRVRLERAMQVGNPNVVIGGRYVVGQGCQPHACGDAKATVVVDTRTGRVLVSVADGDGRLLRPDRRSWPVGALRLLGEWDDTVAMSGRRTPGTGVVASDRPTGGFVDLKQVDDRVVYDHNGSEVLIDTTRGLIVYAVPKPSLARAGVVPGQVLLRGRLSDPGVAEGTAFVFRRGCAPAPYRVSGAFANASDGTALVLKGKPPRRLRTGCAVQGHSDDRRDGVLRFRFLVSP